MSSYSAYNIKNGNGKQNHILFKKWGVPFKIIEFFYFKFRFKDTF